MTRVHYVILSLLILVVGCATDTISSSPNKIPILDNLSVMGRYVLNNVVLSVNAISRNQVAIKMNGGRCSFSGVGTLSNNKTSVKGAENLTLTFSKQDVKIVSSKSGSGCIGTYIKKGF